MNIDPGVITLIQASFLQRLGGVFTAVSGYALNLLYIFAGFEIVVVGISWALQSDAAWGRLFFKIIKIGLIFLFIQNYPDLISIVISGFAKLAGVVVNKARFASLLFNPAQIWQYGYDVGLYLLQSATASSGLGLTLVLSLLGMGVLLVFGLLGIQVVLQLVGFYLVALVGLMMLPLGAFTPSRKMFDRAVQAVLQAGVRVMTVIIIVGMATLVWDNLDLTTMTNTTVSLNQTLGLFFSALLFLFLAIYLPRFAAAAIGEISDCIDAPNIVVEASTNTCVQPMLPSTIATCDLANMHAATSVGMGIVEGSWVLSTPSAMIPIAQIGGGAMLLDSSESKSALTFDSLVGKNNLRQAAAAATASNFSSKILHKLKEINATSEKS